MKWRSLRVCFTTVLVGLCVIYLVGCEPSAAATATATVCQPSKLLTSTSGFPEIQGSMKSKGEMWALLFFETAHVGQDAKIVWRITGTDDQFSVQATHADGTSISPIWGPEAHGGSNWQRPGYEWGTGFNFPKSGCWTLAATRGDIKGEIYLEVLP